MKSNIRIATLVAALALSFAAQAGNNDYPPKQQPGGDSQASAGAVGVGVGIGHGGDAKATASNTNVIGVGAHSDAASYSNSGGNKLTNEGNNSAQRTNVTVQGDTTQSNTPPVVAGILPSVPTSCRLYLFGGGSTRDGAGSGTFPIGNDQTCLSIAKLNLMERAGGFTQAEKQVVVCEVEGMASLATCKAANGK